MTRAALVLTAALLLVVRPAGEAQWAVGPAWTIFTPANDVSFRILGPSVSAANVSTIPITYEIGNVSNKPLYVPREWEGKCPVDPHVIARLESSDGRHTGNSGFYGVCTPNRLTMSFQERMNKEAVLLQPGDHFTGAWSIFLSSPVSPGEYRMEGVLYGWKPEDFSQADQAELAKMGAPFLRGEVPASAKVTLTPAMPSQTADTSLSGGHDDALVHVASTLSSSDPIVKITPTLPAAAKRAGITGPVVLEITVDQTGNVTVGRVLHGDPLLNEAAEDAVKQWKYRPVLVDGRPASVVLSVSVAFKDH
jgi:TonB family protein